MTTNKTAIGMDKTKQKEGVTTSGQPQDSAENPVKQEWRDRRENKGRTKGKRKERNKVNSKENRDTALEREDEDQTGRDEKDGDGDEA